MSAHFADEAARQCIVGLLEHMLVGTNTSQVAYPPNTKDWEHLKWGGNALSGDTFAWVFPKLSNCGATSKALDLQANSLRSTRYTLT